jgi:hypothetical protein
MANYSGPGFGLFKAGKLQDGFGVAFAFVLGHSRSLPLQVGKASCRYTPVFFVRNVQTILVRLSPWHNPQALLRRDGPYCVEAAAKLALLLLSPGGKI